MFSIELISGDLLMEDETSMLSSLDQTVWDRFYVDHFHMISYSIRQFI